MVGENFLRQSFFSYKSVFMWLNWPAYSASVIVNPMANVLIYGLTGRFALGSRAAEPFLVGMTAYAVTAILVGGIIQGFYYERSFGTLSVLFLATGNRLSLYFGRGVLHFPNAVVCVSASVGAATALGVNFDHAEWAGVVLSYGVMAGSVTLFALCLGNLVIMFREWSIMLAFVQTGLITLTGVVVPREELPSFLQKLGDVMPLTHGVQALRTSVDGSSLGSVADELAAELAIGLIFAVVGFILYVILERYSRKTNAYEFI
jgi:ABC-2 type transport system permease protein